MTPVTWTRKAAQMRDKLLADSPEYGFTVARRAVHLATCDAAADLLDEVTVRVGHVLAARRVAGDQFMPDMPAERTDE